MDICQAIRNRHYVSFDYDGHRRIAIPVAHGTSADGKESLRAYQTGGTYSAGGFDWGTFTASGISNFKILDEVFVDNPPYYIRGDGGLHDIHCELT